MKSVFALIVVAVSACQIQAHYVFPSVIVNDIISPAWTNVRQTNNWQSLLPLTNITSPDLRCFDTSQVTNTTQTTTVAGGSKFGFTVSGTTPNLYHPGVINVYMAKAPGAVADWEGSGSVWFKVYQITAIIDNSSGYPFATFPSEGLTTVNFTIPATLPSGEYLVRIEHIALQLAGSYGGAQFYIACAPVAVTNGGSGTPGPLVSIPGVYTGYEPGILFNQYYPPTTYTQPGPAVWPTT